MVKTIEKFGAEWCGPCKVMDRNLHEFRQKHPDVTIRFIDVDEEEELTQARQIKSVPVTFLYNEQGELIGKFSGVMSVNQLETFYNN